MGLYDRDYYRQRRPVSRFNGPQTMVGTLIVINVAIYVADVLVLPALGFNGGRPGALAELFAVHAGKNPNWPMTLTHPWMWWQFVTYAFAHDPRSVGHILFNMLALFFLGRAVEYFYGFWEFLRVYLVAAVLGGVAWALFNINLADVRGGEMLGASGAITCVVILFALNFPRQTLLLFFVLPVPAWLVGVFIVGYDIMGAMGRAGDGNVAYSVHLAGAAFAALYFYGGWNLGRLARWRPRLPSLRGPRLRLHDPPEDEEDNNMDGEVDRILEKIHREGEESLTRKERRVLEEASREAQRRRRD